jgi:phosphohistidine swiveling domain-containing protein/isopentenyldiphosphate isomerase
MLWKKAFSREYTVQYCEIAFHSGSDAVKHLLKDAVMKHILILTRNRNQCFFLEKDEEKRFVDFIDKEYSSTPERFRKFVEQYREVGKAYVSTSKRIAGSDLKDLDNSKIKEFLLEYQNLMIEYTYLIWIIFMLNEKKTAEGLKLLTTKDDKVIEALFTPVRKSASILMQERAASIKNNKEEIRKFWKEYQWLPCLDLNSRPWSLEDVEEYIDNTKPAPKTEQLSFDEAAEKAGLDKETKEKFNLIREFGYLKDERDEYRRQAIFYILPFFEELARRMETDIVTAAHLMTPEILDFLDGKPAPLDIAEKRKQGFLLYMKDNTVHCIHGKAEIEQKLKEIGFREEITADQEVKGTIAFKGKARGTVKIVRTVEDTINVNKGDILVAVTTHPDYVPAMQKAAAIITEEGGMLSHAAIVSRELEIPCIVGTTNATKVLQHGQLVEVDADNGKVLVADSTPHDPDEILSVVDDNDNIISDATRAEIHTKGLTHREAYVLIISDNKLILQKRADNFLYDYSSSGHFPNGQSYLEGALRETEEELGLKLEKEDFKEIAHLHLKTIKPDKVNNRFIKAFVVKKNIDPKDIKIDPKELAAVDFFTKQELQELLDSKEKIMTGSCKRIVREYIMDLL